MSDGTEELVRARQPDRGLLPRLSARGGRGGHRGSYPRLLGPPDAPGAGRPSGRGGAGLDPLARAGAARAVPPPDLARAATGARDREAAAAGDPGGPPPTPPQPTATASATGQPPPCAHRPGLASSRDFIEAETYRAVEGPHQRMGKKGPRGQRPAPGSRRISRLRLPPEPTPGATRRPSRHDGAARRACERRSEKRRRGAFRSATATPGSRCADLAPTAFYSNCPGPVRPCRDRASGRAVGADAEPSIGEMQLEPGLGARPRRAGHDRPIGASHDRIATRDHRLGIERGERAANASTWRAPERQPGAAAGEPVRPRLQPLGQPMQPLLHRLAAQPEPGAQQGSRRRSSCTSSPARSGGRPRARSRWRARTSLDAARGSGSPAPRPAGRATPSRAAARDGPTARRRPAPARARAPAPAR